MSTTYKTAGFHNWVAGVKARWWTDWGFGTTPRVRYAASNSFPELAHTADGQDDLEVWRYDADNALRIGGEAIKPHRATMNFPLATNASIATQCFFIAPTAMTITGISCQYETADGAANTAYVSHDTGTIAPGTGTSVMVGTFNLNTTANVVQNATMLKQYPLASQTNPYTVLTLAAGDRLSFKMASAVTSLAGLVVSVYASPAGKGQMAVYNMQPNGDLITQTFFLANRPFTIQAVQACWSTKSSSGTSTIDITKDTSTNAPGAGTTCLSATIDATGTANTVATGALSATASVLTMAAGDRLAVKYAGAGKVALAGVVVVVWFTPTYVRKEVTFNMAKNANIVTQPFWIADRDYYLVDLSEIHKTLGTDGGAVTLAVTIDSGTTAAGGGLVVQTDNTNAGFSLKATNSTTQIATLANLRNRVVPTGARLSVLVAGVITAVAGVTVTCSLEPR